MQREPNVNFLDDFKELTKFDENTIKAYEESKNAKKKRQEQLITAQDAERESIMQGNKRPRNTYYEDLWASKKPGDIMTKKGRGKYSREMHIGKTCNNDESRHMKAESKRLHYRGKQYMSMSNYEIKPAKTVIMFINYNGMLLYLKYFLQLILTIMVIDSV